MKYYTNQHTQDAEAAIRIVKMHEEAAEARRINEEAALREDRRICRARAMSANGW